MGEEESWGGEKGLRNPQSMIGRAESKSSSCRSTGINHLLGTTPTTVLTVIKS